MVYYLITPTTDQGNAILDKRGKTLIKREKKKREEGEKLLCNAVILIMLPQNLHLSSDHCTYPEDQNKGQNPEAL